MQHLPPQAKRPPKTLHLGAGRGAMTEPSLGSAADIVLDVGHSQVVLLGFGSLNGYLFGFDYLMVFILFGIYACSMMDLFDDDEQDDDEYG